MGARNFGLVSLGYGGLILWFLARIEIKAMRSCKLQRVGNEKLKMKNEKS